MSAPVAVVSIVNYQRNLTDTYAVNASRTVWRIQNQDQGAAPTSWTQLPTIPGSATPIALGATYKPQLNIIVLTVVMGDNTSYEMLNPGVNGVWLALPNIPTT